jgi:D-3-phosphoglycerate dehydrogenase / 2-oxoglutarate reductase
MMSVTKHLKRSEKSIRDGQKHDYFTEFQGIELEGLTLGLVGLGRIGGRVARFANALGMKVLVYDPFIQPDRAASLDVTLVPALDALLSAADVVSLHAPLTPETQHLINEASLAKMKSGAYLINAARGGLVDEAALLKALESGHLHGAGLDVFDPEPPKQDNPLLHRDDVITTPHIAGATPASKDRLWRTAIEQVLQVLREERPLHLCNPEIWTTS